MNGTSLPTYAVFDDYRYSQRVVVAVRWFLIAVWFVLHNYDPSLGTDYFALNALVLSLAALNGYVHWRIRVGRPITWGYVLALSGMDLAFLTVGIAVTSAFQNTFFVLYYPALLGLSLVANSWRLSMTVVALVSAAYAAISLGVGEGPDFALHEEKILLIRVATMFAVVVTGNLITRTERERRREAVEAERERARENIELQQRARDAEMAARRERDRIARDIHDGIAQSIYALSLRLETCADVEEGEKGALREQVRRLVPLAKQTLLETRHYIHDLKPLLSGERDLMAMAESQVKEFRTVSGTAAELSSTGDAREVSVAVATGLYRILQEALANVLKHAEASTVRVALDFDGDSVRLSVEDDGVGIGAEGPSPGYGLDSMRQRAAELAGTFEMSGGPGRGTTIGVRLPAHGGAA